MLYSSAFEVGAVRGAFFIVVELIFFAIFATRKLEYGIRTRTLVSA